MNLMDDHILKVLKYDAEMLEKQARENDSAASTFLKGEYSIADLGKDWTEKMTEELQGLANSALRLANEIRFKISK